MPKEPEYRSPYRTPVVEPAQVVVTPFLVLLYVMVLGPYIFALAYLTIPELLTFWVAAGGS